MFSLKADFEMIDLDQIDRRLLAILQEDATVPIAELAERVGLSQTPCWKRVRRLQDAGVITARVALLDREALDLGLTVFVAVKTGHHDEGWLNQFAAGASALPEVVEFYRMSGDVDYLLKVVVKDIAAYDRFYKRLIATAPLTDVSSSFAMEQIKFTTALPIAPT
ncbi:Lrp/AsnC family transcriptional regulator [Caulobacter vibrioides]|nr:Lrp/AsnC family transcriptional regulator [Caulobacter vibrioides]ATC23425.1 Lrp/AsnC family transcriptional regulator [Caulobacter vibrioides]AZH11635.1 Lrp/AsnC family transcriptional regulator [Caulobacter vibrioides]PLR11391.1 Lrp/AsnC family transcriptional regulator [Caulobacter vibrioides]